jgi:E3 ubiquitin-protein ligase UBR7
VFPSDEAPALDVSVSSVSGTSTQDPPSEPDRFWDYEHEDEEQDPDVPPALIPASKYDALICGECVRTNQMLRKWAGQKGSMMVIRDRGAGTWRILGGERQATDEVATSNAPTDGVMAGQKRSRQVGETDDGALVEPPTKKLHIESSNGNSATSCRIPSPNPIALAIFAELDRIASTGTALPDGKPPAIESTGDIFLTQGWRERWCRCSNVRSFPFPKPLAIQ